ncbi:amidohydrolase family protein [Blastococcus colisei]|uniref:amidohydrolase family protein n=1 Tax=Blastococcus colisei TaxID=1564162 RepID=UPI001B882D8D|nr:amidohydrolase family protein [Blastococcus colisei]
MRNVFVRSGRADALDRPVEPEALVEAMDEAGVDVALLSAWHRPGGWVVSNDDVASFTTRHPERFAGVASVDLSDPVGAVRELRRAVEDDGFVGLRLLPWLWERPPDHALYYPLYAACVDLGVPFCTQVGHTGPLRTSETGRPIPYIDQIALDFPELVIVGGHIGYPWTDEMISLAWKHPNVYIDTSAYLPKYYPPQLVHYIETYGRDKVMFATNWPQLDHVPCLQQVAGLGLSDAAQEAFLGGNAARVFRLPAGPATQQGAHP